jgi:transglutaminase-like putative cysteine protease
MPIRAGYELEDECVHPTPMLPVLAIHPSRFPDRATPHTVRFDPPIPSSNDQDGFGNICTRVTAPAGRFKITADFQIGDTGLPDIIAPEAKEIPIEQLPEDALVFLLGSRYCETDALSDIAWSLFGNTPPGWARVQAICDYVKDRIAFDYMKANAQRTAWGANHERIGVCRDYAHLAVAFCRCMNIPARYCTGYLGDIGVPPDPNPMDFSAWFEAFLGGRWYTFDARNNTPRIGRILMARGRDATDVAISTSFGPSTLVGFKVVTDEVPG